jgi:hypothetical protein
VVHRRRQTLNALSGDLKSVIESLGQIESYISDVNHFLRKSEKELNSGEAMAECRQLEEKVANAAAEIKNKNAEIESIDKVC